MGRTGAPGRTIGHFERRNLQVFAFSNDYARRFGKNGDGRCTLGRRRDERRAIKRRTTVVNGWVGTDNITVRQLAAARRRYARSRGNRGNRRFGGHGPRLRLHGPFRASRVRNTGSNGYDRHGSPLQRTTGHAPMVRVRDSNNGVGGPHRHPISRMRPTDGVDNFLARGLANVESGATAKETI